MSCSRCGTEDTNLPVCMSCQESIDLHAQVTVLKAERDEAKRDLDRLATAFENAMKLVTLKEQAAYISGWMAGRVVDERVAMTPESGQKLVGEAVASFRRWCEDEAKFQQQMKQKEPARG